LPPAKGDAAPEKKRSRSFLHPFRKPVQRAEFKRPVRCLRGPCPVCPPGESRNGGGACTVASNACPGGQSWNGFACNTQYWLNDCSALANLLEAQRRQMLGRNDPGQSLIYRLLSEQYQSCLSQNHGLWSYNSASLFDTP
jgi:hypothetical protein